MWGLRSDSVLEEEWPRSLSDLVEASIWKDLGNLKLRKKNCVSNLLKSLLHILTGHEEHPESGLAKTAIWIKCNNYSICFGLNTESLHKLPLIFWKRLIQYSPGHLHEWSRLEERGCRVASSAEHKKKTITIQVSNRAVHIHIAYLHVLVWPCTLYYNYVHMLKINNKKTKKNKQNHF